MKKFSCNSKFNNISGFLSGGVVGKNEISNIINSTYNSNIFPNFNTSGICFATIVGESIISRCVQEIITTIPSTLVPSTAIPSTAIPSTAIPSTTVPSTTLLLTPVPPISIPSTSIPSTQISSTLTPSTHSPSTIFPSTFPPNECTYNVPSCQNCGKVSFIVDPSLYNISCVQSGSNWYYSFTSKTSNQFIVTQAINLNESNIIIEGNFSQTSDSTIFIVVSENNRDGALNINGCVSINGSISLALVEQPNSGDSSFVILKYNCSDQLEISDSQVTLATNYQNSKCDKISSQLNNQQNSLSITISSKLNSNCKKKIFFLFFYFFYF